jgi:hypothetical protein
MTDRTKLYISAVAVIASCIALIAVVGCDNKDSGPTSPSLVPSPIYDPIPAPAPTVTAPETPAPTKPAGRATKSNGKAHAWVENVLDEDAKAILVCYCDPTGNIEDQVLQDTWVSAILSPGDSVRLSVDLPSGAYQCDVVTGMAKPLKIPYYREDQLIAFITGGKGPCEPTSCEPNCPPPPTPGCTPPPGPKREHGPATYDPTTCTWTCPPPEPPVCPEPRPEPRCPSQRWLDYPQCRWVGECTGCPIPRPKPECPEQVWSERTCKWIGECIDECTLECGDGYELDEIKCECVGLPLCHVSNKGGDADWNLQESQKKYSPGHDGHFGNCPPDYWGTCDGRFNDGHPCTSQ